MVWFFSRHYGMEMKHPIHRYSEGRSASGSMFIRGFPLYGYVMTLYTSLFCKFYRPLWNVPPRVKWFDCAVDTMWMNHQNHRHQAPCLSGVSPIWLFKDSLHPLFCIFSCPLWIIPTRVKWLDFSVGTMEVNYQIDQHSEGRSASGLMCIRGFPLYGYLMTVSTPICA